MIVGLNIFEKWLQFQHPCLTYVRDFICYLTIATTVNRTITYIFYSTRIQTSFVAIFILLCEVSFLLLKIIVYFSITPT